MAITIFVELSIIIIIAVAITAIMRLLKQPLIIGYILTGVIVSPYFLNIVKSTEAIATFAQIGIALLLFMVGLNLNPKRIKDVGKVSLITGIGQVIFTSLIGFFICFFLGFPTIVSIYIAIALTFSSTIIIMKILSDKNDLETLYGRIAIGFLIVQDLIAIVILMVVSAIPAAINLTVLALETALKLSGLLLFLFIISVYIFPKITRVIAKSQEFLLLFSIGWCFAVAALFYYLNFSIEAGALLAGIALSFSPYNYEISSKMKPLRDFFIILFFILLGSQMVFANINQYIIPILIFSAFILVGNPFIVMALMGLLGYTKRNSFLAGLTVAQISEFSLILIALGVKVGHLTNEILSLVTMIGLITIAGSTYMIIYANKIYPHLSRYLGIFERKGNKVDEHSYHKKGVYDILLFGYNRIGYSIVKTLQKMKKNLLIVDFNPDVIKKLITRKIPCIYGDVADLEILERLELDKAEMVISTVPEEQDNLLLIKKTKEVNKKALIFVTANQVEDALTLYDAGADYVILPHLLGGEHVSILLEDFTGDINKILETKLKHIDELHKRRELGHEHPMNLSYNA